MKKETSPQPLVSVIVPAYNAERYIGEAIESVLGQTYPRWELVVVDDGSTDATAAIVKAYASRDFRIRYFYQENQRMASARNAGIARARGISVAFLDADNLFLPEKLAQQVDYLERHPRCGVAYGVIEHFYDDKPHMRYANRNEVFLSSGDQFRELLRRNSINVLAVLVRKEVLDKYGAFPTGWRACDEQYLWVNLARHGVRFCGHKNVVGQLRLHGANDSRRSGHLFDTAHCFLQLLDIVESSFSADMRRKYTDDIVQLRREWKRRLFMGALMRSRLLSWFFMPMYRYHFRRNFIPLNASGKSTRAIP